MLDFFEDYGGVYILVFHAFCLDTRNLSVGQRVFVWKKCCVETHCDKHVR